jgi:hypothetical protein
MRVPYTTGESPLCGDCAPTQTGCGNHIELREYGEDIDANAKAPRESTE